MDTTPSNLNQTKETKNNLSFTNDIKASYTREQLDIFTVHSAKNLKTQKTIIGIKNKLTYVKKYKSMERKKVRKHIHYDCEILDRLPVVGDKILVKTIPRKSKLKSKLALKIL